MWLKNLDWKCQWFSHLADKILVWCPNLDKIGMTGTVDVGVVPFVGGVLQVSRVDGDATGSFFRSIIDWGVILKKKYLLLYVS